MKAGWEVKQLGDVISLEYGKPLEASARDLKGLYPVYGANGEISRTNKCYYDRSSIIVGRKGSAGEINLTETKFWPLDVTYFVKLDESLNDLQFIYYLLESLELRSLAKGVKPGINRNEVYSLEVKIPSKVEQQRIVTILDQAFEGIAKARANAEKNLQNSRALFESFLQSVFTQRGNGWQLLPLSRLTERITKGSSPKWQGINYVENAGILFVTSENVGEYELLLSQPKFVEDKFNLKEKKSILRKGDVLTNIVGASIGRTAVFESDEVANINQAVCLIRCEPILLNNAYLVYLLNSPVFKTILHDNEVDNARANLSLGFFANLEVPFPSLEKQNSIVQELNIFRKETQRLENLFQRKITLLDELKKSLLQQAFAGELTSDLHQNLVILSAPSQPKSMSSTDLHAGILVLAYQKHEEKGNVINFGHVKAEKIAHMLEAKLGIDLGRAPIKAAAGPNDYPHLKMVESRARKAGYFDFKQVDGAAYRVVKLSKFDDLADKTRTFLAEKMPEIDELLELMLPMDTQQAEIFCTVYAAWNNLLLDGQQPTDENIVFEARENWHPDKLKIPREKFFAAIDWMRNKKVFPEGKGKKVLAKK